MSLSMAVFTFINAWWVCLFLVLPFSIEKSGDKEAVEYAAAPKKIYWKKAIALTSVASLVVTLLLALLINSDLISLRNGLG